MKVLKRTITLILTLCLLGGTLTVLAVDWPTHITGDKTVVLKGVDVSEWQYTIDWDLVKSSGIDFALIRSGWGTSNIDGDKNWLVNAAACAQRNIPFGVYYYSYAYSTAEAHTEASNCISQLNTLKALGYRPILPIFYDLEDKGIAALDHNVVASIAQTFCDDLKAAGYEVGIYSSSNWIYAHLDTLDWSSKYLWLADWRDTPDANLLSKATYFQFTDAGSIPGIGGNVDLDVCLNPSQQLLDAVAKNRFLLPDGKTALDFTSPSYRLAFVSTSPEIGKIPGGTTVSNFLSGLVSTNTSMKVFDGQTEASGDKLIGTGMKVQFYLKDTANTPITQYCFTTVVTGDINGDGSVGLSDLILLKSHLLGNSTLTGAAAEAAEISGGSEISLTDFIQLKGVLLGNSTITPR